ncbi:MAG: HAMP domain-containing protein [Actinobacteria bacterium]|uniref:histidine kinase n=1 Tax=freshwater metagenome TaxID=449393 RepID=A0A6J7MUT3_9ZZZZ|nr:HAMP domain-containing protein [Actinomycetota bacterium]MSW78202.1 HAMP domain-containing protein [Actinomycetota bacterium]MSX54133.1 HAMP domain-containing protein [Actinomycetota bacterium]MSX93346.1 HAMP domain-containing protein [Actinomycetota bacterium]MSZ83917.1 HAMP domain-containing protein [Actinomycetota bacterium]
MKLRTRLSLGLGAIAVAFAVTGYLVATTQHRYLTEQVDRDLQRSLPLARGILENRVGPVAPDDGASLSKLYIGHLGADDTLVTFVQGQSTTGTPEVTVAVARVHVRPGSSEPFTVDGVGTSERWRVLIATRRQSDGFEIIALSLESTDAAYQRLLIATGVGALAVVAIILLIAAWVMRLGVRPIREMTATADAITSGETDARMASYPAGTEAAHLANAFNSMLDERDQADERLRQFVADASHELRTPLTSIRGYADLYRQGGLHDSGRLDDAMRRVSGEAERMGSIVNDLLLLTNLDRGLQLHFEPLDIADVLADVVADARVVQPDRQITLAAEHSLLATADRQRLHQVVAALVHNALVHTPVAAPIDIIGRTETGGVVIEVIDHGAGMDDEMAARAFERFYRGDPSRSRHSGGSGLGLAITTSIVEAHGGRIALHTAPGAGCRFTIALPGPVVSASSG